MTGTIDRVEVITSVQRAAALVGAAADAQAAQRCASPSFKPDDAADSHSRWAFDGAFDNPLACLHIVVSKAD
jgi:hypothetical protein